MTKISGFGSATIGLVMLALSSPAMATPVVDFVGGNIVFDGRDAATSTSFTFSPGSVTNPLSGPLFGAPVTITGSFTIGPSINIGCSTSCFDVGGTGTFTINQGQPDSLTGTLDLVNIFQAGSAAGTNFDAAANLTGISSTGLLAGYDKSTGIATTTFQFQGPVTLASLAPDSNTNDKTSSYSGTLSPVPEPSALFLLGSGLLGLVAYGRRKMMNGQV